MASVGTGGGLLSTAEIADAALVLERTSVHDNTAGYIGGGVASHCRDPRWSATLHVTESTVHANQAATGCGGLSNWQSPTESIAPPSATTPPKRLKTGVAPVAACA